MLNWSLTEGPVRIQIVLVNVRAVRLIKIMHQEREFKVGKVLDVEILQRYNLLQRKKEKKVPFEISPI